MTGTQVIRGSHTVLGPPFTSFRYFSVVFLGPLERQVSPLSVWWVVTGRYLPPPEGPPPLTLDPNFLLILKDIPITTQVFC